MSRKRTGLLIIRAWVERGSSKPLRAHIRMTTDVGDGFQSEVTLADSAAVSTAVDQWLNDISISDSAASDVTQG